MVLPATPLDQPLSAGPFLKWAGGKTQLLQEILPRLPQRIDTYFEPFIGGGAVFFALANARRFRRAVVGDANPELVELYTLVRDDVEGVIEALGAHADHGTDAEYFYALRGVDPATLSPVERAARLLYLNKTCFNGLYRVNKSGRFNVPFGRYANPRVLNADVLRAASGALEAADVRHGDFSATVAEAGPGDAVYFDPPYVPRSSSSSFKHYHASEFGPAEHARLRAELVACQRRGAHALLSNSDCPETRDLYRGLDVHTVHASRAINSVGTRRGRISEVLVVGRPVDLSRPRDSALPAARVRRRATGGARGL